MKILYSLMLTTFVSLLCACFADKKPENMAFYKDCDSPHAPYRILGTASIAKRNLLGMERSTDTMQAMIKQLAANMGGDGLINLNEKGEGEINAQVIAYQKILI